jgi:hypothetical protein
MVILRQIYLIVLQLKNLFAWRFNDSEVAPPGGAREIRSMRGGPGSLTWPIKAASSDKQPPINSVSC